MQCFKQILLSFENKPNIYKAITLFCIQNTNIYQVYFQQFELVPNFVNKINLLSENYRMCDNCHLTVVNGLPYVYRLCVTNKNVIKIQ